MILGSHLSVSGGLQNALFKAGEYGFDTVAVFVRNQRQWSGPPLAEQAVETFRQVRRELAIAPVVAHGSYLMNLAGEEEVRQKSIAALTDELDRCGRLGIEFYVFHPGSCADTHAGIARIAEALNGVLASAPISSPRVLLETTAGQGNCIGSRFEHLADILGRLHKPRQCGVCMDTCHIFAAGYDMRTPATYQETMRLFDSIIGMEQLAAIHVNDSVRDLGSCVDRHAHIGHGKIGLEGFANLVNDSRLADTPMILETPKEQTPDGRDWDLVNAQSLRELAR